MPARAARLMTLGERTREAALAAARGVDPAVPDAEIVPVREPEIMVLYTVGGDDSPLAQRTVGTRGQSFATR